VKVISSLAKKVPDCKKLVELKSNKGVPFPILISLDNPQLAALYISKVATFYRVVNIE
jgi:hypothetical protein